jgi:hypothetical protein
MRVSFSPLVDVAWALLTGAVAAISLIPMNVIAILIWLPLVIRRYRRLGKRSILVTQFGVLAVVLVGAALAPCKTTDALLARRVHLDARQMSLQQLDAYVSSPESRQRFPIWASFAFAEDEKDEVVSWPSEDMTLAEFIAAIESQTVLRHRFRHCGNGWTLLSGGDCSFGLIIRDRGFAADPSRKRYEGGW